jgi:hypothetical protein
MGQGLHSHRYSCTVVPGLDTEVRNIFEGVNEAIGEISRADGQGQLDDLSFVVKLAQFLKPGGADAGGAACHAVGEEGGGLFLFIEEWAARIKRERGNLLRGDAGAFRRSDVRASSTRFSLWGLNLVLRAPKPHRLKRVLPGAPIIEHLFGAC